MYTHHTPKHILKCQVTNVSTIEGPEGIVNVNFMETTQTLLTGCKYCITHLYCLMSYKIYTQGAAEVLWISWVPTE